MNQYGRSKAGRNHTTQVKATNGNGRHHAIPENTFIPQPRYSIGATIFFRQGDYADVVEIQTTEIRSLLHPTTYVHVYTLIDFMTRVEYRLTEREITLNISNDTH